MKGTKLSITPDANGITIKLPLHRKVAAGGAGGAFAVLLVYLASLAHIHLGTEEAGAIVALVGTLAGYLTPLPKQSAVAPTK